MADFFIADAVFAASIGLLGGMLTAGFAWNLAAVFLSAVFVVPAVKYFGPKSWRASIALTLIIFLAVLAGVFYFHLFSNWRTAGMRLPDGKSSLKAVVTGEPVGSEKYLSFSAKLQSPFSGKISVFAPPDSDIHYGDLVNISGTIEPPRSAGEAPAMFPKRIEVISSGNSSWLMEKLLDFKSAIGKKFGEFLTQDTAALLGGMTLGGTAGMSMALKNEMTISETLYITSMYGYKIAMIIIAIEAIFASFIPRRIRFCMEIFVVLLFVLMSGMNISAVRGGVMACVLIFAKETGSIFSKRNALALTAVGIAIFDPIAITQAGFLFSFTSVAGMALLTEPIRKFLRLGEGKGFLAWKEAVILSVASLLPIVPLISALFGSFSLTAIFANILIAPVIPLGMTAGVFLAMTGFVSGYFAFFVARTTVPILNYALWIVHFFAMHTIPLPFSFSGTLPFLLYYGAVGLFVYAYRKHGKS